MPPTQRVRVLSAAALGVALLALVGSLTEPRAVMAPAVVPRGRVAERPSAFGDAPAPASRAERIILRRFMPEAEGATAGDALDAAARERIDRETLLAEVEKAGAATDALRALLDDPARGERAREIARDFVSDHEGSASGLARLGAQAAMEAVRLNEDKYPVVAEVEVAERSAAMLLPRRVYTARGLVLVDAAAVPDGPSEAECSALKREIAAVRARFEAAVAELGAK